MVPRQLRGALGAPALAAALAAALTLVTVVSGSARAAAGRVTLPEDATAEALVLALADANPAAERCLWREAGRGTRVVLGKAPLPGVLTCDPAVVGPALAGRTRAGRVHLAAEASRTAAALDRYGEVGAFFAVPTARELALGGTAAGLWDSIKAPDAVLVLPGPWNWAPEAADDPACAGVAAFSPQEIAETIMEARDRMSHCWRRGAKRSAFTFDVVTDRDGAVQPKLVATLRSEPTVATCLVSALALVRFDPARARCHQVRTQWPVTSGP